MLVRRLAERARRASSALEGRAPPTIEGSTIGRIMSPVSIFVGWGRPLAIQLRPRRSVSINGDAREFAARACETDSPPVLSAAVLNAPRHSTRVIQRAMGKAPGDRFPSGGDLGRAPRAALTGKPPEEAERTVATGAATPGGVDTQYLASAFS